MAPLMLADDERSNHRAGPQDVTIYMPWLEVNKQMRSNHVNTGNFVFLLHNTHKTFTNSLDQLKT
jgi:hypothetical protein